MQSAIVLLLCIVSCCGVVKISERARNVSLELVYFTQLATEGHVVISPFGIWTLMAGISLGTTSNSYEQLKRSFRLPKNSEQLIEGYKNFKANVLTKKTNGVTLACKNFLFLDSPVGIFPDFRRTFEKDFDIAIENLDFSDPKAAETANSKIEQIDDNFRNVIHSDDFNQSTMILANVIAFRGLWSSPFDKTKTKVEVFYDEDRNPIGKVNMMYQISGIPISNIEVLQSHALEMPYGDNDKYCMLFLLPYEGVKIADAYKNLALISMWEIFDQLKRDFITKEYFGNQVVEIMIPRFQISTNVLMNKPLVDTGVVDIFDPALARFDRISNDDIYVSAVIHAVNIEVAESDSVDTSSTTFDDKLSYEGFIANRPFAYFLMEKRTMTMILGGIYSKPKVYYR